MPLSQIIKVGNRRIGPQQPIFVIAEIGINHEGDEALCARMIDTAKACGADAVKLQTVDPLESYVRGTASFEAFTNKQLSEQALKRLMDQARRSDIILFSTPGDFPSLARMMAVGMELIKISSGLLTNLPLIRAAARSGRPLILSTGMAWMAEVREAVETAHNESADQIALLQCTSLYPAPPESLNLCVINELAQTFGVPVGYSDHHPGGIASVAAVAAGAQIIEKHFTLDASAPGADHAISLEPEEFAAMVADIRRVEKMRGSPEKRPTPEEEPLRVERHRCLTARRAISAGEIFTEENLALKRPLPGRVGLAARNYEKVIGLRARRALAEDEPITEQAVEGIISFSV